MKPADSEGIWMKHTPPRRRGFYAVAIVPVVVAGLLSRSSWAANWPTFVQLYAGDTLWALALFLTLGFLCPKRSTAFITVLALVIACAIELSQLYQAPWINALRETALGALILGFGFKWSDLICYAGAITLGAAGKSRGRMRAKASS